MSTAVRKPFSVEIADAHEREVLMGDAEQKARIFAEALASAPDPYQFATDGSEPAPTVQKRIREALRELRGSEIARWTHPEVAMYERATMSMVLDLLDEAIELDATREAIVSAGQTVTTDDSAAVTQIVDDMDENPHRVAVRLLRLEREVKALCEKRLPGGVK